VVVSEAAARTVWPGEDPLGKRVAHPVNPARFFRVVGVVADLRAGGLDRPATPAIYRLFSQTSSAATEFSMVIRAALPAAALSKPVRDAVWNIDPEVPVPEIRSMNDLVQKSVQERRFQTMLLCVFATVAVVLAALGIYGVVAFSLVQRRKEIGVRVALGANQRDVRRLIFRYGLGPVCMGLAGGVAAAAGVARLIASLLFEVSPWDPLTFTAAPVVLALAAVFPCWLTARQAGRIDPVDALRLD